MVPVLQSVQSPVRIWLVNTVHSRLPPPALVASRPQEDTDTRIGQIPPLPRPDLPHRGQSRPRLKFPPLCSILLLQSCDGFEEGNAIFCCSESACRGYTQAGYEDLGFDLGPSGTVPDLQCAETNPDFMAPAPAGLPTGPDIPDDEPPLAIAPVLVADFSTWPGSDSGIPIITIDEERVGRIPIRSFQTGILPGAFSLSSSEASAINDIVEGLVRTPPLCASTAPATWLRHVRARPGSGNPTIP